MLLKCVIQAEYYDGVNKEDTPEQYLCSPVVIYTNGYGILELQVINAENRLLLQEMQAQKFLPCPNNPQNVHYTVLA